jgi:hypothetical protein
MIFPNVLMRAARVLTVAGALIVSGCNSPDRQPAKNPEVRGPAPTFNKDIAPILFERCAPCHRPGQAAPFALLEYPEVKERAEKIVRMTKARRMPGGPVAPRPRGGAPEPRDPRAARQPLAAPTI